MQAIIRKYIAHVLIVLVIYLVPVSGFAQNDHQNIEAHSKEMKIDIWSDIMCPFCYIGKRHLEQALQQIDPGVVIKIEWHSFQLDPDITSQPGVDVYTYLAERKGWTRDYTISVHNRVVQWAKEVGLDYRFDLAVVANSFRAHQLIQLAKTKGLGHLAEERLFRAYFTEGKNVDDIPTLISLGVEIGLSQTDIESAMDTKLFAEAVKQDVAHASAIGITGVPYFLFDGKYAISGAQPVEVFLETINKAISGR